MERANYCFWPGYTDGKHRLDLANRAISLGIYIEAENGQSFLHCARHGQAWAVGKAAHSNRKLLRSPALVLLGCVVYLYLADLSIVKATSEVAIARGVLESVQQSAFRRGSGLRIVRLTISFQGGAELLLK